MRLQTSSFDEGGLVELNYAWRYAPGDEPGREAVGYDDSRWTPVKPALTAADLPPGGWSGVGWFRRHLRIGSDLQAKTLALRFAAPGAARVYLDGRPVLSVGEETSPPEIPSDRSEAVLIHFEGSSHVLAVRYAYPRPAPRTDDGFGFHLTLSKRPAAWAPPRGWPVALRGALVALPVFLALLHLALFSFDPRARENLFYALEMFTFAAIVLREYRDVLLVSNAQRDLADRVGEGLPIVAILFGALTYYAIRTRPWPKSWRAIAAAGAALYPLSFLLNSNLVEYSWIVYFLALVIEIFRLERGKRIVKRQGARFYLGSFAIFGLTVALQILVNLGLLESVVGVREVYVLGILASAVGMSLYLASTLGQSRIIEAENERKTRELTQARDLQLSMLPGKMPQVSGLDIAAATQPAAEVGGDYYDVKFAGDDALLFAFGDATGHGLAAGIVVTAAKALFTSLVPTESPCKLLASCDRAMAGMKLPTLRMCLSLAHVSPRSVTVASAAMPPLLVCRAGNGEVEELGAGGLPLGGRMAARYEERTAALASGDTLLFASDGFAELAEPSGRQLGYGGVIESFRRSAQAGTAGEVVERLFADAARFRSTRSQDDDVTFVAVRVLNENP
ncbi:MAG TPA: SpoIIE family protein phosphatase [Thermoanaerobaculia bacterium]|nr:SpoIIE family protein phosphatase [Thermoanaerobaculia bacterium]